MYYIGERTTSQLIQALNYIGQNAKTGEVVNMSLGTDTNSPSLDNAVLTLAEKGILFSIASGNESQKASHSSPGSVHHPNVVTASAIDSLGRFASFSSFGIDLVDFASPGVRIVSTYSKGRYTQLSGTPMAAPHGAGILVFKGNNISTRGFALNDPNGVPDAIASYKLLPVSILISSRNYFIRSFFYFFMFPAFFGKSFFVQDTPVL